MFSASSEARDRNAPTNANQIRLQTSRIGQEHRPIRYQLPARLSFRQGQRPKQIYHRPNNEPDKISHPATASSDSRSTASQIEFATGTATIKAKAIAMNSAAAVAVAVFRSSIIRSPFALSVFNGARDIRDWYAIVINQASIKFEL